MRHTHVAHMAKRNNMAGALFGGGPLVRAPCPLPKSGAAVLMCNVEQL